MIFSKGCINCRSRRIKCNELRPRCTQCARAGLACSGYRTQADAMFKDQTEKVSRRPHNQKEVTEMCNNFKVDKRRLPSQAETPFRISPRRTSLSYLISIPIESIAQTFFFNNYSIVTPSYAATAKFDSCQPNAKLLSITAVGMAGLANSRRDPGLMVRARAKYEVSLRMMKETLHNQTEALKEATFASVFVMSMFEMIACEDPLATESWLSHIHGATALVALRSKDDWNSAPNLRGFLQVWYITAMGCLLKGTHVPPFIMKLIQRSQAFHSSTDLLPASQLFRIVYECAKLRDSISKNNTSSLMDITGTAIHLEQKLLLWVSALPSSWTYRIVALDAEDKVYGPYYCLYEGSWQASVWNYYRICRLLIHSTILHALDTIESSVPPTNPALALKCRLQRTSSEAVLSSVPSEICASIPYQLGLNKTEMEDTLSIPKPSGVFGLFLLLQVLIGSTGISRSIDNWLSHTLQFMGNELGIRQALVVRKRII